MQEEEIKMSKHFNGHKRIYINTFLNLVFKGILEVKEWEPKDKTGKNATSFVTQRIEFLYLHKNIIHVQINNYVSTSG